MCLCVGLTLTHTLIVFIIKTGEDPSFPRGLRPMYLLIARLIEAFIVCIFWCVTIVRTYVRDRRSSFVRTPPSFLLSNIKTRCAIFKKCQYIRGKRGRKEGFGEKTTLGDNISTRSAPLSATNSPEASTRNEDGSL